MRNILQRVRNFPHDYLNILENSFIGKSQYLNSKLAKAIGTKHVMLFLLVMNHSIKFDPQTDGWAKEIQNVLSHNVLAPEFVSHEPTLSKIFPQHCFGSGWLIS